MNFLLQWFIRSLGSINATQWQAALQYVIAAEERITAGEDKRAWVLDKLRNVGVTGRYANLATEMALAWLKRTGGIGNP